MEKLVIVLIGVIFLLGVVYSNRFGAPKDSVYEATGVSHSGEW